MIPETVGQEINYSLSTVVFCIVTPFSVSRLNPEDGEDTFLLNVGIYNSTRHQNLDD
jgi:hypothetical protein